MSKKKYHLFIGDVMRYEALFYEDSFVELNDAFQSFVKEEPSENGIIMQNREDGGLIETHSFNAEHYWKGHEHAYEYSISPLVAEETRDNSV